MPLDKSGSKSSVSRNIEIETAEGKPHDQAVAIAMSTARRSGLKIKKPNVSKKTLKKGYKKL